MPAHVAAGMSAVATVGVPEPARPLRNKKNTEGMIQTPDTTPARRDGKLQTCLNDAPGNLALH